MSIAFKITDHWLDKNSVSSKFKKGAAIKNIVSLCQKSDPPDAEEKRIYM